MADVQSIGLENYGQILSSLPQLANQTTATQADAMTQAAQRPNIQAQGQLIQAQAQGAQLANQFMQAKLSALNDSGLEAPAPTPQAGTSAPSADTSGDISDLASAGLDPAHIAAAAQQQFAVKDQWTPQEQYAMRAAAHRAMVGWPDVTTDLKTQHDARIQTLTGQAQLGASQAYEQSVGVNTAPTGTALTAMGRIHPDLASAIQKLADKNDWTPDQTDQVTRLIASETANQTHRYSGRKIDTTNKDGVPRDDETQQPLIGGLPSGLSSNDYSAIQTEGLKPVTWKDSLGQEHSEPQYIYDHITDPTNSASIATGKSTASLPAWVNQSAQAKQAAAKENATPTTLPPQGGAPTSAPQVAPSSQKPSTTAAAAAPKVTATSTVAPAAVPNAAQRTTRPLSNGFDAASLVPGIDVTKIPKSPGYGTASGTTGPGIAATAAIQQGVTNENAASKAAEATIAQASKNITSYDQLAATLAEADPNMFGPRGPLTKRLAQLKTFVTGLPPDSLINVEEASKYLAGNGVFNAKSLLGPGQQLRQTELLLLMSKASPNTDQPLPVIKQLMSVGRANNEYDMMGGNTTIAAMQQHANPFATAAQVEGGRAAYVANRSAQLTAPPTGSSASAPVKLSGASAAQQYAALPRGAHYVDPTGQQRTKP